MKIETVDDICDLVRIGFDGWEDCGNVRVIENNGLLMFTYTQKMMGQPVWNRFETMSRGLIIEKETGRLVAYPFEKFFNNGERGRIPQGNPIEITEKMDGSLGILYWKNGVPLIATKGSFHSEQAIWATFEIQKFNLRPSEFVNSQSYNLLSDVTLMFEIVYPKNRIVVKYDDNQSGLYLIGGRCLCDDSSLFSQIELDLIANRFGFKRPKQFFFKDNEQIFLECEVLENAEGFVAKYSDGSLFKFKSPSYLKIHRLINSLTFSNVAKLYSEGKLYEYEQLLPEELQPEFQQICTHIFQDANTIQNSLKIWYNKVYSEMYKDADLSSDVNHRKTFALKVQEIVPRPYQCFMYKMWQNGTIPKDMLYRTLSDVYGNSESESLDFIREELGEFVYD